MGLGQQGQSDSQELNKNAAPENGQQPEAPNAGEDVWDEERIEKALKTLKEMHIQVSTLTNFSAYERYLLIICVAQRPTNYHTTTHCAALRQAAITYVVFSVPSCLEMSLSK
jgi:hypothetical protein